MRKGRTCLVGDIGWLHGNMRIVGNAEVCRGEEDRDCRKSDIGLGIWPFSLFRKKRRVAV